MSFILDALRKSENERQREATPTLARAPLATVRRQTPLWIWFVIGMLSLALLALAIGWWRTNLVADSPPPVASNALDAGATATPVARTAPAASDPRATGTATPSTGATGEPLPITELGMRDPGLPDYALQFIEFNAADPAEGSAWINGTLYRPGERIGVGPELVEIRSDSVILAYRGETFLLRLR